MERGVLGGGQPCGLAAALAQGRRPPKAGGGPTKYQQLALRNSLHRIGIRIVLLGLEVDSLIAQGLSRDELLPLSGARKMNGKEKTSGVGPA
jgi:hypothetical protein